MSATLMKKIAAGDREALKELYSDYKGLVFAAAVSVLRRREDAEDAAAETFLAVMKNAAGFRGGSVKAYLAAIAKNIALNMLKKNGRTISVDFNENQGMYGEYGIEEDFADNLALKTALKTLSGEEREIVLLYNAGMKHREIAKFLKFPLGTVTYKYSAALKKLKAALKNT